MKLFAKYNRFSIVGTVAICILSSFAFYFVMKYVLTGQVDDALQLERTEIELAVAKHHHLPEPENFKQQSVAFTQVDQPVNTSVFSTIPLVDTADNEIEDYRQLQFGISVNNNHYLVTVRNSLVETDELLRSILPVVLGTIVLILATIFIINRVVLKRLWRPFYKTLSNISDFEVSSNKRIEFEDTRIEEFAFMNSKLENLIRNVQTEYDILKQFTENAAHEMQTPLAVVNSKLDLLANDENLSQSQSNLLEGALDAVQKLSKLNQSLLLLAKIENKQFAAKQSIALQARILQKLGSLRELFHAKQIEVIKELEVVSVKMNPELCDILLNNLLGNAVRHNKIHGTVRIYLTSCFLKVINTGRPVELDSTRLFSRFYKAAARDEGTGLGLSIMKQICDLSGLKIEYHFADSEHIFTVRWPSMTDKI